MNMQRMILLGVAIIAAAAAAFLARGMLGGSTPRAIAVITPPQMETRQVLVAAVALQPGQPLNATLVRWDKWPASAVDATFITQEATRDVAAATAGTVVRAPIVVGGPITTANIVHSASAGFMAATLMPGMRAVSIPITVDSGAGGFILPNDRVDLIMTEQVSDTPRRFRAHIVLSNVRVLAVDQTFKQDNEAKVVLAKTATLELSSAQAQAVIKAQAAGPLSLALRPLDSKPPKLASATPSGTTPMSIGAAPANDDASSEAEDDGSSVNVIRFGVISGKR
jgi:pilus assembly protein CpaB